MKNVCILAHLNTCQHVSKGTAPDFFPPVQALLRAYMLLAHFLALSSL